MFNYGSLDPDSIYTDIIKSAGEVGNIARYCERFTT